MKAPPVAPKALFSLGFFRLALAALLPYHRKWTGGRVVECTALEMRRTCKGIVGSNPTLSANSQAIPRDFYFAARAFPLLFPLCLMSPVQGQLARPARTTRRAFKAPTTWLPRQSTRASTVPKIPLRGTHPPGTPLILRMVPTRPLPTILLGRSTVWGSSAF